MDGFTASCAILAIAIVLGSSVFLMCKSRTKNQAPKARGGWPIIGHLPLLNSDVLPHRLLGAMADTYGPIFRIKLGVKEALVISSKEMAKECLVKNESAVLDRGKLVAVELTSYNYAMFGFSPYGPYWRHMRKIATLHLLSKDRCNALAHVFESEVSKSVRKMYAQWWILAENGNPTNPNKAGVLVDLTKVIAQLTLNLSVRTIFGVQLDEEDDEEELRIQEAIKGVFKHAGSFAIGDALPFMRWIVDLGGQEKAMKKCFKELDNILQGWLDEHKRNRCGNKLDQDVMGVMLSMLDDDDAIKDADYDADTINKATCMGLLLGGSDTTEVTLTWAFSLLLNNPEVMKKAKQELNIHVGKERQVSISDIPKLVYIEAIVKETLRLYPPAPLMGPREFIKDSTISNYHVKNGTQLIVNISKISRDPRVWDNPLEFRPERFFDTHKNVDFKGRHLEYIPFGVGRRICPGISFALQGLHLFLATLLHAFEFSTPHSNALVDMTESFGLTTVKAKPLYVLLAPTLHSQAYGS